MSFFLDATVAERYARAWPDISPLVIGKMRVFLAINGKVGDALAVGCGTGMSTRALKAIARRVVGSDISREMLQQAVLRDTDIAYVTATAERLPFTAHSFDLITASLAFHWFDREAFLSEASRLLRPGGWLVIYNNWFLGQMAESPAYEEWNRSVFLRRYPTPPRNNHPFTEEDARRHGFTFAARDTFSNEVQYSAEQLAEYLRTQSNIIAVVEQGKETCADAYRWLQEQLQPLFAVPVTTFQFGGSIWYLRRDESEEVQREMA